MSSGENWFEVLFKLWASISKMVLDGNRKAEEVAKYLQRIVDDPNFAAPSPPICQVSPAVSVTEAEWRKEWQRFYQEVLGHVVDFTDVDIKADPGGFRWVVFVAAGLTTNKVWSACRARFSCYSVYGDDLDKAVPQNERDAKMTSYTKLFRDCVEADEQNKNLSANALAKQSTHRTITLMERLLLELWYHWKTGNHLDLQNVTLCAGSRLRFGGVPGVRWLGSQLQVDCYDPDGSGGVLRARSAV